MRGGGAGAGGGGGFSPVVLALALHLKKKIYVSKFAQGARGGGGGGEVRERDSAKETLKEHVSKHSTLYFRIEYQVFFLFALLA